MKKFAAGTKITSDKSESEIRSTLKKFGATNIIPIDDLIVGDKVLIGVMFEFENMRVKISVDLPDPDGYKFTHTPTGKQRTESQRHDQYINEVKRLWRSLAFKVKGKLISIDDGISDFTEEFFYNVIVPGSNQTVGEIMRPQLGKALETGKLPPLLPGIGETA